MEEQERTKALESLRSLMSRGRLQVTDRNRELIEKAMAPLPPPWEWQERREQVELTAVDMEVKSGTQRSRVRYWETGGGTMYPEQWLDYAARLTEVISEILRDNERASLLRNAQRVPVSAAVAGHQQQLRSVHIALTAWAAQDDPCTLPEAVQVNASLRETIRSLQAVQRRVQRLILRKEQQEP